MTRSVAFNVFWEKPSARLSTALVGRLSHRRKAVTLRSILIKLISASERRSEYYYERKLVAASLHDFFHSEEDMEILERRRVSALRSQLNKKLSDAESRYRGLMVFKVYRLRSENAWKAMIANEVAALKTNQLRTMDCNCTFNMIQAQLRREDLINTRAQRAREHVKQAKIHSQIHKSFTNLAKLSLQYKIQRKLHHAKLRRLGLYF